MTAGKKRARLAGRRSGIDIKIAAAVVAGTMIAGFAAALPAGAMAPVAAPPATTLLAAPVPNASAVGPLTPRGCTVTGATTACDLYAKSGTTTVTGASVPIWGFASDDTGVPTAPGPLLVVTQGAAVTITLHNLLTSAVSLALPGQKTVNGGGGDDLVGAAPNGGTATYTFTANRPGSFVYEAGHTPNGARQVAMGLAGALVVLPTTTGTLDGNPTGYPDTTYNDDAPLVLSELDPALNASPDPLKFDMRNYHPTYRLINGHTYPSGANTIATDQGHKVLVRYVNVGQQMHSMSVLGAAQVEVAQDGHPMKYSTTVTAESIDPGVTLDAIVTMPSAGTAGGDPRVATKVAIYEANGSLDNNAQVTQDTPARVGFGGMLAFLDTQAPVDISNDYTGPTAKAVTVNPPISNALSDVTVRATISDATNGGSTIKAAEYVIDDDNPAGPIAPNAGTPMTLDGAVTNADGSITPPAPAITTTVTGTIPAALLASGAFAAGKHIVYVRGQDVHNNWGVVGSVVLNVPKTGPSTTAGTATPTLTNGSVAIAISATGDDSAAGGTISSVPADRAAEYFIDNSAGVAGTGTVMKVNRTATVVSVDATLPPAQAAPLLEGVHHFWVHVKDDLGLWGPVLDVPFTVDKTGPATLASATSPVATNGITSDPSNPGYLKLSTQIRDDGLISSNIVQAEAFIGTVRTSGSGLQLRPVDGKLDSSDEAMYALIPLSQFSTTKTDQSVNIFVHGKDAAGNWGSTNESVTKVIIDRTAPKLTGLAASLPPPGIPGVALTSAVLEANTLNTAEVWTGNTDPGVGKATPAQIGATPNGTVTIYASIPSPAAVIYHIRVRDAALNWSNAVVTTATTSFRSNLESTTGWGVTTAGSGATASASIVPAAAQPNADELATLNGFQANIALSPTAARVGYLRDNSPAVDASYHARFQFTASTLNSGANANNVVTVFDTRTATGANNGTEVFAVQYRGSGTGAQIRVAVGTTVGGWKTVGTTQHKIQVDWTNGTLASLVLTIDSAVADTVTRANQTQTIRSAQLGVSASTNTGATGKAWFDTFLSVGSS